MLKKQNVGMDRRTSIPEKIRIDMWKSWLTLAPYSSISPHCNACWPEKFLSTGRDKYGKEDRRLVRTFGPVGY